jgi:hypothetical protein
VTPLAGSEVAAKYVADKTCVNGCLVPCDNVFDLRVGERAFALHEGRLFVFFRGEEQTYVAAAVRSVRVAFVYFACPEQPHEHEASVCLFRSLPEDAGIVFVAPDANVYAFNHKDGFVTMHRMNT